MSRFGYVMVTYFVVLIMGIFSFFHHRPRVMWNTTASAPLGLYALHIPKELKVGDLVADLPPPALARFMAERHYLPLNVPLLKYVGAITGQNVCRQGATVTIDGLTVATALATDHANRPLPVWQGCRILKDGEIFLLNPSVTDSFDGRYYGAVPLDGVTAVATPLWTESAE
jgi:conjugative transfer signal peptidase TraF